MIMSNLHGSLVSNICSAITGGLGFTPAFDIGNNF